MRIGECEKTTEVVYMCIYLCMMYAATLNADVCDTCDDNVLVYFANNNSETQNVSTWSCEVSGTNEEKDVKVLF